MCIYVRAVINLGVCKPISDEYGSAVLRFALGMLASSDSLSFDLTVD
jgi:hypothetical protein